MQRFSGEVANARKSGRKGKGGQQLGGAGSVTAAVGALWENLKDQPRGISS